MKVTNIQSVTKPDYKEEYLTMSTGHVATLVQFNEVLKKCTFIPKLVNVLKLTIQVGKPLNVLFGIQIQHGLNFNV